MSLYDGTAPSYQSLDEQPSLDYFMQFFSYYLKTQENNNSKIVRKTKSRSGAKLSPSVDSYLIYRKNIHNKLAELNANVSDMIIDSFKGIDTICFKVRQCMSENEDITRHKSILMEPFCEYETEQMPQIAQPIETLTNKEPEIISTNSITKNDLLEQNKSKNKLTAAKLSRKIKKRSLLLEEFRETIIENINNGDYEMMEKIIENINEEIESFTTDAELQCDIVLDNEQIKADRELFETLKQKDTQTEIGILNAKQNQKSTKLNTADDLPKTLSIQIENLSEEKFDLLLLEKLPLCENLVIPDVYSRPGVLDINKKLLSQLDANDSFICFQRLMSKNKRRMKKCLVEYPKSEMFNDTFSTYSQDTITSFSNESFTSQEKYQGQTHKKSKSKVNDLLSTSRSISRKSASNRIISGNSASRMSTSKNSVSKKSISRSSVFKPSISKNSISKSQLLERTDGRGNKWKRIYMEPDLREKYSNSLWFSEKYVLKTKKEAKSAKSNHGIRKRLKITNRSNQGLVTQRRPKTYDAPSPNNSLAAFRSDISTNALKKCATGCSCTLSIKNVLPSRSNTACRQRWMRAKTEQSHGRTLQFLDILDDLAPKDLLPLRSEYPRKDVGPTKKNVEDTYLYKLLYGGQDKQAWDHLLQPNIECSHPNCTTCGTQNSKKDENRKQDSIFSREKALEKLAPHIIKQPCEKQYFQYYVTMPVRVFYDRHKTNEVSPNRNTAKSNAAHIQKSSSLPMKETKGVDRATWSTPGTSKPMKVVHDTTVKPEITNITPANKKTVNSATHNEEKIVFKKKISKSFSPKGFSPYCSTANHKKLPKQQSYIAANKTMDKYIKIQSDIEKKAKDIQEKSPSGLDKKLWANKYGKGVGHQLVTFIKNQPPHPTVPLPKYAVATRKTKDISNDNLTIPRGSLSSTARHKQVLAHLHGLKEKNDEIQNNLQKAINVIEAKMIDILSTPGDSSSVEAFDVMEKEITNVLSMMKFNSKGSSRKSTPNNRENAKKTDRLESDFNLISEQLFKKLESILESDKSKGVSSTSDSDKKVENKDKQNNKYAGHKSHSPNKNSAFRSLSATSTSIDENDQTITQLGKGPNQHLDRIGKKSKMSKAPIPIISKRGIIENNNKDYVVQKLDVEEYSIEQIEREYATGESYGIECTIGKNQTQKPITQDYDETDNSRGDCIKQDISKSTDDVSSNIYCNYDINTLLNDSDNKLDLKEPIFETASKEQIEEENNETANVPENINHLNTVEEAIILIEADVEVEEGITIKEDAVTEAVSSPELKQNESLTLSRDVGTESESSDPGLSGEVNNIIKRVEDIYSHLDDIQFSNDDHIPVFWDTHQVPNVHSEEFLTPFMQAVKDKRNRPDSPTKDALQRSPSYFNVLNFLDTLSDIQQETPIEVHTARLCYYCQFYHLPEIFHQATLEYKTKPSCLKKNSDEGKSKHKKVSFLVMKENKSCQVAISPFHNTKTLKVSSQQFPPTQNHTSPGEAGDNLGTTSEIFSEHTHLDTYDQLKSVEKSIIVLCDRRNQSDYSSEIIYHSLETTNSIKDICEETKPNDTFEIDKFTQVYCQMQTEQTEQTENSDKENGNENNQPEKKYCERSQQVSEVSDDSKSSASSFSDATPQIQVFYDQSNADIPKLILQNQPVEGKYSHPAILQVKNSTISESKPQSKIVVFREVLDTTGLLKPLKHLDISFIKDDLEKNQDFRLPTKKSGRDLVTIHRKSYDREMLLKSFYAIIYILMFTALNLEYRCP